MTTNTILLTAIKHTLRGVFVSIDDGVSVYTMYTRTVDSALREMNRIISKMAGNPDRKLGDTDRIVAVDRCDDILQSITFRMVNAGAEGEKVHICTKTTADTRAAHNEMVLPEYRLILTDSFPQRVIGVKLRDRDDDAWRNYAVSNSKCPSEYGI